MISLKVHLRNPLLVVVAGTVVSVMAIAEAQIPGPVPPSAEMIAGANASLEKRSLIVTPRYFIGPEDVLEVSIWRNADLSKVVTVRPDGKISLPLTGDLQASGLTPPELAAAISLRLQDYLQNPTVSVILKEMNSYSIYIMGQVKKPGRFFLNSKTTLLQAITLAGGFTPTANRSRIVILQWTGAATETKLTASYPEIVLKDRSDQNVLLKPGDTIVVPSETMVMTN